jgi:hypothetical protein
MRISFGLTGNLCAEATLANQKRLGILAMEPNDSFEKFKRAQIGEEIHQPLIFAILVILISITLYFIF